MNIRQLLSQRGAFRRGSQWSRAAGFGIGPGLLGSSLSCLLVVFGGHVQPKGFDTVDLEPLEMIRTSGL
jgi:hypothetical protein